MIKYPLFNEADYVAKIGIAMHHKVYDISNSHCSCVLRSDTFYSLHEDINEQIYLAISDVFGSVVNAVDSHIKFHSFPL